MVRVTSCVVAALLVAGVQLANAADDRATCSRGSDADEVIAACSRQITLNPRDAAAYGNRGGAYTAKGDYDRAIADMDQALRLNPKLAYAYNGLGNAYSRKGEYDRAIAEYDQALRLDPKLAYAYGNRGAAYDDKGDFDRAIADCDQALRLDPKLALAYGNRGLAYGNKGDYDRAIVDFDQAIRLDRKNARAYRGRGFAYNGKADYDRAIADLDVAIAIDPDGADGYSHRGFAYGQKGDLDRAMADLDKALVLDPGSARAYVNRAVVEALRGDRDRARADFDTALKLAPNIAAAADVAKVKVALAAAPERPTAVAGTPAVTTPAVTTPAVTTPAVASTSAAAAAPGGRRIALVIGMGAYASVPQLRNPLNDARAVAEALRRLGFAEVIEREDLTRARLEETLKDFGDKAAEADWAVIYYAGHGVEMNGENYLVPVDARLARVDHVEDEAVSLKRVLSKAEAAHKLRMVILDACRNNPFRMAAADGRSRAISRGLSPVEPSRGVLVAYAARDGTTADDGDSGHSPFTQALLANLETPNLDIRIMFSKVRDQVLERTNNAQEPFTYGSLPGEELYFRAAAGR